MLAAGRTQYIATCIIAENVFLASYGADPLSDVDIFTGVVTNNLTNMQIKYGSLYDAMTIAFTVNAVIEPATMNVSGLTGTVVGAVSTINVPGLVLGKGLIT